MTTAGGRPPGAWAALAAVVALLVAAGVVRATEGPVAPDAAPRVAATERSTGPEGPEGPDGSGAAAPGPSAAPEPSAGGRTPGLPLDLFGRDRTLVAFYGTAGTGALGVLGEARPDVVIDRLDRAAQAFARPGRPVQVVFELIVTIADATPGPDGDYAHDLPRDDVERYIRAAHRHGALLLLDLQPGRATFPEAARRWAWALRDPRVGLALDPEWRMGPREVPGQVIGSVDAAEVNEVSLWLANLARSESLPQKLLVLHQFRTDMIERIDRIAVRDRLATVQHVDGFGTPSQKIDTYRTVLRPDRFHPGFKLFYDEDVSLMSPARVLAIRPRVRFVSYQ